MITVDDLIVALPTESLSDRAEKLRIEEEDWRSRPWGTEGQRDLYTRLANDRLRQRRRILDELHERALNDG